MPDTDATGAPVVLLHGWGGSYTTTWNGSALERSIQQSTRRLVPVDLPGHGPGGGPHDPAAYFDMARQLGNRLPDEQMDAIGYSLGGKLLLQLATEEPERFRRLVIIGVGANLFRPENGEQVSDALLNGPTEDTPSVLHQVVDDALASANDPRTLSAVIRRPPSVLTPEDLDRVSAEIVLITGSDDLIAGPVRPLAEALPQADAVAIDGLDHVSTPHDPQVQDHAAAFILAR